MRVLVVWSNVPESTHFIDLPNVNDITFELLKSYHGKYINSEEEPPESMYSFFHGADDREKFVKSEEPTHGKFDLIIHCGFIL